MRHIATRARTRPSRPPHRALALAVALGHVASVHAADDPSASQAVTVTAARGSRLQDMDVSTTVIRREQIEQAPQTTVEQIVNRIPGVFALNQPSGQLHPTSQVFNIRGFGTTTNVNTLLMVDGVPANDPYFRTIDWRQIPKASIERIEVIRGGGASSLWGNLAMGGIVNIVTRDPGEAERRVGLAGGSHGTWLADGAVTLLATDALRVGILVGASGSDGYQQTPEAYLNTRMAPTASRSDDVLLSAVATPSPDARYHAKLSAHRAREASLVWDVTRNAWHTYKLSGGGTLRVAAPDTRVHVNAWVGRSGMDTTNSGQSPAYNNTAPAAAVPFVSQIEAARYRHVGGSAFVQTVLGPVADVKLGLDARQVGADDDLDLYSATAQTAAIVARGTHRFVGVFAQGTWRPLAAPLDITLGLREDLWQARSASVDGTILANGSTLANPVADTSVHKFNPRLGAKYGVNDEWAVRGAIYRNFAAPGMNQMYRSFVSGTSYTATSPTLKPQTNVGQEIGIDFKQPGLGVSATVYHNRLDEFIDFAPLCTTAAACNPLIAGTGLAAGSVTRVNQYVNAGRAVLRGFEVMGRWQASPDVLVDGGFSRTNAYLKTSAYTAPAATPPDPLGKQLGQVPLWTLNLGLQWQLLPGVNVSMQGKAFPPYWNNTAHTQRNDGALLLDAGVTWALRPELTLWGSVQNLGDRRYNDQGPTSTTLEGATIATSSIPALGIPRTITLGLRYAF
ncbi:MAG: TonB-dependent receptor [Burkholderiaceae bacterium]